jgi:hypothetical protein
MRAVLLGNDFIELQSGEFKFLETNTNTTFEFGFQDYVGFENLFTTMSTNGWTKLILLSNHETFNNYIRVLAEQNGVEFSNIAINLQGNMPVIEDDSETLVLRIAYDGDAIIDAEYAANKTQFYNLIKEEGFAIKTYFKGDSITQFVESYNNFPNYVIKGNVPNLSTQSYPKYYKLNTIEEVQTLIDNLDDTEMITEFVLSANKIDNQLCTIRSLDVVFSDLSILNVGVYHKSMYFSKEEIGEFEYDGNGLLNTKYRYALTNDLRPYNEYSGDTTDTLLSESGVSIPYSELQKGMNVQGISIADLPLESTNGNQYENWQTTDSELIENTSFTISEVAAYEYSEVNDWLIKVVLDNGFEWNDGYTTKLLVKKSEREEIKFNKVEDLETGDVIYFWNSTTNEYVTHTVISTSPIWVENQIIYKIDISPNDVYLTSAYDDIKFVQHNFINCDCCFAWGYYNCGMYCCNNMCSGCGFK